ncbi:helicase [Streptococcus agalactiae]|nr:helicase [Streptococcus agalactiae]KLJ60609.1 helicase [Streptococcus agalactiae]KLJ72703.1 helicase [Streptococcus agalactiae]KLK01598.1 helicase [Streptococcus agalactiae]KLK02531.1 helicase [Streptococcus agalactiae]
MNEARRHILKHNVMIVSPPGSGKSVVISDIAKSATQKNGYVLFLVHRKELIDQITNSFKFHGIDMNKVDLMTVGKAKNRLDKLTKPTLIITDEGHHGKASTYQMIYEYFSDVPRIGFTATPWRLSGDGFTDTYDVMVLGKTVEWLINNNKLAPYDYYSVLSIDTAKLKVQNGDYSNKSIDESFGKKIFGDVVQEYIKKANGQKAILYAHSVEASQAFAKEFQSMGINAIHADAKTPKAKRDKSMKDFRDGKIQVICNVDLISEGFDVPDCTVTILCRPTKSLVLFLQQSMRSMRYQPNKKAIILDHVGNWNIHGLPDTPHHWENYFRGGWKKKSNKTNTVHAKECPVCSALWPLSQQLCELCNHDFGLKEKQEKERIEAELELIKRERFRIKQLANKKFGKDLKTNWEIAQARVKDAGKGKPLYKLIYFYLKTDWVETNVNELAEVTGKSEKEIYSAYNWLKKKLRG